MNTLYVSTEFYWLITPLNDKVIFIFFCSSNNMIVNKNIRKTTINKEKIWKKNLTIILLFVQNIFPWFYTSSQLRRFSSIIFADLNAFLLPLSTVKSPFPKSHWNITKWSELLILSTNNQTCCNKKWRVPQFF